MDLRVKLEPAFAATTQVGLAGGGGGSGGSIMHGKQASNDSRSSGHGSLEGQSMDGIRHDTGTLSSEGFASSDERHAKHREESSGRVDVSGLSAQQFIHWSLLI